MPDPFYPSDLTDAEGEILDFMLPLEKQRGKQKQVDFRQVVKLAGRILFRQTLRECDFLPSR